jgi:acid phosphatase type 7
MMSAHATRSFGRPGVIRRDRHGAPLVRASDQLQGSDLGDASGAVPLPQGSPGVASAEQLGITDPDEKLPFFLIGDHGGVETPTPQLAVAHAMEQQLATSAPAFVFSVGDWVYFGGDVGGWDTQVYEPYENVDVPFVGIAGNHDDARGGDPPLPSLQDRPPLDQFMANMCTPSPQIPDADPQFEYGRHTECLPYCDWTLPLQAITIIGIWSNVPSGGVLQDSQLEFLTAQLKAAPTDRPLAVALHHPPYSIDAHHGGSPRMGSALDGVFTSAGRCPELVLTGHVHDFQVFKRTLAGSWGDATITYVVIGNSGYHNLHPIASDYSPGMEVADGVICEYADASQYGYLSMRIAGSTIQGEYIGVTPGVMADGSDAQITPNKFALNA